MSNKDVQKYMKTTVFLERPKNTKNLQHRYNTNFYFNFCVLILISFASNVFMSSVGYV